MPGSISLSMKKHYFLFKLLFFIPILTAPLYAQNISTEGKDFWLGFMENHETSRIDLEIFISASDTTTGIVEMPYYNWSTTFVTYPGNTAKVTVPTSYAMNLGSGNITNRGIHISAENNVSVYALNKRSKSSDATVVLPSISLGKEYMAMAHMEYNGGGPSLFAEILVVAISDETEITITPSVRTTDGNLPGVPFQISLNEGQTYQLQSEYDLTGTKIETLNAELGDCKNFAVFGGNEWTRIGGCNGAQDNLYEQMFPINTWGNEFISIPYKTRIGGDMLKILAAEDSTIFTVNGTAYMLNAGKYTNLVRSSNTYIESDKPISVGQFSRSQSCDGVEADPFFIMLSPLAQRLKNVTFNALEIHVVDRFYLNVVVPASGMNSTLLDGINISDSLSLVESNPEYAFAQIDISVGDHTIECDDGFIAYVYGYGNIESFGYATGVSLQNLNLKIESSEPGSDMSIKKDSTCIGDPVEFSVEADSSFIFFDWDFVDGNYAIGKTVDHSFDQEGIYPVKVTANTAQGACSSQETSLKYIHVVKPEIGIYGPRSVCPNVSQIEYRAIGDSRNNYEWFVVGGTITTDSHANTVTIDWGPTNSEAYIKLLPRNYLGCYGDTLALNIKINVQLDPAEPFGNDSLCSDLAAEIEYEAYLANGSIYNWHTDLGEIVNGQGNYISQVSWSGPGIGKLWYEESSALDDVCSGWSDTLTVFIERAPEENIAIVVPENLFHNGDSIPIHIDADPAYNYYSWDFGDGHTIDSITRHDDTVHIYPCNNFYLVNVSAYTGTVCQNTGIGNSSFEINKPELEMLYVSNDTSSNKNLHIGWNYLGSPYYQQAISLLRKQTFPDASSWELTQTFNHTDNTFIDEQRSSDSTIYQYKVETNYGCQDTARSLTHENILLTATEIESDSSTQINWNNYVNWKNGVQDYEIWRKIDGGIYSLIDLTQSDESSFPYDYDGFDFCYRIRAIENGGNNTTSWSNETCVEFVPAIKTYNFFSPNDDPFNQYLIFDQIELYQQSELSIYNRFGKKIKRIRNYQNDWDGKVNGNLVPSGTYYYYLKLNEPRNELKAIRGYFTVMY